MPSPEPLNPNQYFVVLQYPRAQLAELINTHCNITGVDGVTENDPRLTDPICRKAAQEWGEILEEGQVDAYDEDQWQEAQMTFSVRWLTKLHIYTPENKERFRNVD